MRSTSIPLEGLQVVCPAARRETQTTQVSAPAKTCVEAVEIVCKYSISLHAWPALAKLGRPSQ